MLHFKNKRFKIAWFNLGKSWIPLMSNMTQMTNCSVCLRAYKKIETTNISLAIRGAPTSFMQFGWYFFVRKKCEINVGNLARKEPRFCLFPQLTSIFIDWLANLRLIALSRAGNRTILWATVTTASKAYGHKSVYDAGIKESPHRSSIWSSNVVAERLPTIYRHQNRISYKTEHEKTDTTKILSNSHTNLIGNGHSLSRFGAHTCADEASAHQNRNDEAKVPSPR